MKGKCYFCGREITSGGGANHIKNCKNRLSIIEKNNNIAGRNVEKFILLIKDKYIKDFWMYISMEKNAKLKDLDNFIRHVWVECCYHLSCFNIRNKTYGESRIEDGIWDDYDGNLNIKIKNLVQIKSIFEYEYDFGYTTYLTIKVIDEFSDIKTKNSIEILARNNEPTVKCSDCDKNAKYEFIDNDEGFKKYLCDECIKNYNQSEDNYLEEIEFTNSPRFGICDYEGEKEDEIPYLPLMESNGGKLKKLKENPERDKEIKDLLNNFGDKLKNEELKATFIKLFEALKYYNWQSLERGKSNTIAAGIVHAVLNVNRVFLNMMLLEKGNLDIRLKDIADYFNVSEGTLSKKSKDIRDFMDMEEGYEDWKVESIYKYTLFESEFRNNNNQYLNDEFDNNFYGDFSEMVKRINKLTNKELELLGDIYFNIENENYKEAEPKMKEVLKREEEKLGENFIKENKGSFWLIYETREYMELRVDYAEVLWKLGKRNESLEMDKGTLELNPNDNQGVREWAVFKAINLRDFNYAEKLFKDYEEDESAAMLLGKTLYHYNLGDMEKAKQNAKKLKAYNPYIKDYIIGNKVDLEEPIFYGYGDENEAIISVIYGMDTINETLGFKKWIKENM
ncbi:MAG: hypothetical protein KID00_14210 [Clostridium argentinense]|uniref:Tetratricopeptide repeat protein n=1 Tax=Clostridium faecium TaxID=2762223 RepID=A0ABR8YSR9_9CLOT|nr:MULTISPECIES: DUF6398 domain-containing protein [Clostridium]MBD8047312.1 hypothetical protein [Clostridium faecium]MBS5824979.1 hypothetical protein [Clostridium argentinense]MDU1350309.1 DUF6398 domain-containing protein [Clostridium argentinense]